MAPSPWMPDPSAVCSLADDSGRRQVVRLIFIVYLLAIFEGALRKWLAPQFAQFLFFVRDPFLLLAYALATWHGFWPRRSALFTTAWVVMLLGATLAVLQAAMTDFSATRALLAAYGWRSYCLYLPLAFLVGQVFSGPDLMRLYRVTLGLAAPLGLLVALQFFAAVDAPINVGIGTEINEQFRGLTLNAERTRPMGPFTSVAGQQQFVATAFAILMGLVISRGRPGIQPSRNPSTPPSRMLLGVASAGLLTAVALSGSRGIVLQCVLALCFAALLGALGRTPTLKARALLWPVLLMGAAVIMLPLAFPQGVGEFLQRWTEAQRIENQSFEGGIFGRTLYGLVDFVRLIDTVPPLGYGLGYGGNASTTLHAAIDGVQPGLLAETDFARHMVDLGPAFGVGYIVFRLAFAVALVAMTLRATRRHDDPMPMMLLSFTLYVIVFGQITGHGTINVYGWLFAGVSMAACRQAGQPAARSVTWRLPLRPTPTRVPHRAPRLPQAGVR